MGDVAGSYDATALTVTQADTSYDFIADGATIHLVLHEDGTTSWHLSLTLFIPLYALRLDNSV